MKPCSVCCERQKFIVFSDSSCGVRWQQSGGSWQTTLSVRFIFPYIHLLLFYVRLTLYHCRIVRLSKILICRIYPYLTLYLSIYLLIFNESDLYEHYLFVRFSTNVLQLYLWLVGQCIVKWFSLSSLFHPAIKWRTRPHITKILLIIQITVKLYLWCQLTVWQGGGWGVVDKSRLSPGGRPHYSHLPLSSLV